jgi:aspartate aminotransferase
MELSARVKTLTPSSTLAITAKAAALKAEGHDVIGLAAGQPDFNTPQYIIDAAAKAANDGETKYTPSGGVLRLKEAIIDKFKRDSELIFQPSEIIVCTGAKHALYTLFQVLINPGDEVIVPAPFWVSYPEQVKLAGGNPVVVEASEKNEFKITPHQLEQAITDQTKAFILNSPSNPTGVLYSTDELRALGDICVKHDILIVSDEIYEKLIYGDERHVSVAQLSSQLKKQTLIINGVSKSHSMTGWRIGYAAGDETIIKAMTSLASQSTSNPTSIAQYGAIAAYEGTEEAVEQMRRAFEERLNVAYDRLTDIPGMTCVKPKGAFYLFPNVKEIAAASGYQSVVDWSAALLEEQKVAVVPGAGFGSPDNVRLSYATSLQQLEEALKRIDTFVRTKVEGQ